MAYSAAHPAVRSGVQDSVSQAMGYGAASAASLDPLGRQALRPPERADLRAAGAPAGRHDMGAALGMGPTALGAGAADPLSGRGGQRGAERGGQRAGGLGQLARLSPGGPSALSQPPNLFGLPARQPLPPAPAPPPRMPALRPSGGEGGGGGGSLEARVAAVERALAQHDTDLHSVRQDAAMGRDAERQLQTVDEQLRGLGGMHQETAKRLRWLEETVGTNEGRGTGGAAHGERLRQLQAEIEQAEQAQKQLESRLVQLASEQRRELSSMITASAQELDSKFGDKVTQLSASAEEQTRTAHEERRRLDETTKERLGALSTEVVGKLRQLETHVLPASERALRDEIGTLRDGVGKSVTQMSSDLKAVVEMNKAGEERVAKQVTGLQAMAQKGLLSLRSEGEKKSEALARLVKEEINTRALLAETTNSSIGELRTRMESEMEGCGQEIASLQSEVHQGLQMVKASVEQVEESVVDARAYTDDTAAALRQEIGANAEVAAAQDRQAAEVSEVLDRGLKELADGLQSETSERAQAVSDALAATGRVEESVSQLQGEVRAAITKTDLQVSSEAGERRALAVALRQDLAAAAKDAAEALEVKATENAAAVVHAEQRWESGLADANTALQNEMLEERSAMQLKLRDTAEDAERAVERLEADLSDQIAEVRGAVVDDLSTRLETLQEQSEQTLLGFREHMDNEFEAEGDRRDELYHHRRFFLSFFLSSIIIWYLG